MYVRQTRSLKINLWLLVLMVLFIISVVFTIIHISNSTKANTDDNNYTEDFVQQDKIIGSKIIGNKIGSAKTFNTIETFYDLNTIDNNFEEIDSNSNVVASNDAETINSETVDSEPIQTQETSLKLNNHTFKFDNSKQISLQSSGERNYIQLRNDEYILSINTDTVSFEDILSNEDIKNFIEKKYNVKITGGIKRGTYQGIDIIICSISENTEVSYLVITSLNTSEIVYYNIYNATNKTTLINDLSKPMDEISSITKNSIE